MSFYNVRVPFNRGEIYCEITDYDTINDGRKIIFVLPGGPGLSMENYKITPILMLTSKKHLVFLDPPGTGRSRNFKSSDCDINLYIESIEAIRRFFNFNKISLLGVSYGAMASLGYGVKYSGNLDSLLLVAGASSYHFIEKAKQNLLEKGSKEQNDICERFLWNGAFSSSDDVDKFFSIMASLYSKSVRDGLRGSLFGNSVNKYDYPFPLLNMAFSSNFWLFDYTRNLKNILCPVLLCTGKEDWINDPCFSRIINHEVISSKLHLLDSGHSVLYDQPEMFYKITADFLDSLQSEHLLECNKF